MRTAAATFLTLSLALAGPALTRIDVTAAAGKVNVFNFGEVAPTYFRGAEPDQSTITELAAAGVKLVIDLQADGNDREEKMVQASGMKFVRIPMTTRVVPTPAQLEQFLALVNDPANQPVYVHCKEGRHRTGVMTAVYRMTNDGWDAEKAYDEMKQYKFGWSFLHPEFKRFVYAFKSSSPSLKLATTAETSGSAVGSDVAIPANASK